MLSVHGYFITHHVDSCDATGTYTYIICDFYEHCEFMCGTYRKFVRRNLISVMEGNGALLTDRTTPFTEDQ
jgi:hypothetical protein